MNYVKSERYKDKSSWPRGPWDHEPDKFQWFEQGLACLIVRNGCGALCGYVGVPEGHKLYGVFYQDLESYFHVHGGLTYSSKCADHICNEADEEVWWLGFDCAHGGDYIPDMPFMNIIEHLRFSDYKDIDYVMNECSKLARQINELCT